MFLSSRSPKRSNSWEKGLICFRVLSLIDILDQCLTNFLFSFILSTSQCCNADRFSSINNALGRHLMVVNKPNYSYSTCLLLLRRRRRLLLFFSSSLCYSPLFFLVLYFFSSSSLVLLSLVTCTYSYVTIVALVRRRPLHPNIQIQAHKRERRKVTIHATIFFQHTSKTYLFGI